MSVLLRDPVGRPALPFFRGRWALYHALKALGVGEGDEVAIQSFTCLAVPLPILQLGARPVYVDVDPADFGMCVADLRRKITPSTRVLVVQHTFGFPANLGALQEVAREYDLTLIEDCAHVIGGSVEGQELGTVGDAAFYSYEWGKPLVAGVGGVLAVNDFALLDGVEGTMGERVPPPLATRLAMEAQYWAYRLVLSGRTYWVARSLYHRLSRMGVIVGTFREEDLDTSPPGQSEESGWGMAPRTQSRLARKWKVKDELISSMLDLQNLYYSGAARRGLPVWRTPEGREAVLMRFPFFARDKSRLLEEAQRERIELSGMFKTPVDPVPATEARWVGYDYGSCPVAERLSNSVVSAPINIRVAPGTVHRTLDFLERKKDQILNPDEASSGASAS